MCRYKGTLEWHYQHWNDWVRPQNLFNEKKESSKTCTSDKQQKKVTFIGDAGLLNSPVGDVRDEMHLWESASTWRRLKCRSLKMAGCCASRCSSWFHPTNTAGNSSIPVSLDSGDNLFYFATSPTDCTAWPQCVPWWGSTSTRAG